MVEQGPRTDDEAMDEPEPAELGAASGYARALAGFLLFVGVVAAIAGVVVVVNQLTQPGGSVTVLLSDPSSAVEVDPELLPPETWLDLDHSLDEVRLHVSELPAGLRAMTELPTLAARLAWLAAAILLRRVLLEIAAGRPFAAVVPQRLGALAGTIVILAFLPAALDSLATVLVLDHLGDPAGLGFLILSLDLGPLLLAGVVAIVAAVFRHGEQLTQDVEGLV